MSQDLEQWYKSLPYVTKHCMILCLLSAAVISYELFDYQYLLLDISVFSKLQVWRLFTHFFIVGAFGMKFFFGLMMYYFAMSNLESQYAPNSMADMFYMMLLVSQSLNLIGLLLGEAYLAKAFSFAMMYIWCKRSPFDRVTFMFGLKVNSGYLPLVILAYEMLTGQSIYHMLIGLAVAHVFIVFKDILPKSAQKVDWLGTPKWVHFLTNRFYYKRSYKVEPRIVQMNQQQEAQEMRFRAFEGRGVRLG